MWGELPGAHPRSTWSRRTVRGLGTAEPLGLFCLCPPVLSHPGFRGAAALAQRRRLRPVRPCLFYFFLEPRPETTDTGPSARSAVSWCRRNGRGDRHYDRHSIGELRRAASLSLALLACAAESCSIPVSSRVPCAKGQVDSWSTQLCAPSPSQYRRSDLCVAVPCAAKLCHASLVPVLLHEEMPSLREE